MNHLKDKKDSEFLFRMSLAKHKFTSRFLLKIHIFLCGKYNQSFVEVNGNILLVRKNFQTLFAMLEL